MISPPVFLEEAVVVEIGIICQFLELLLRLVVQPCAILDGFLLIRGRNPRSRARGRRFGRQIAELPLNIIPFRTSAFHILVHKVISHSSSLSVEL